MKQKKRINPAFYIMTVPMAVLFFCFPYVSISAGCILQLYGLERVWKLEFCRAAKLSAYFSGQKCWIFVFVHV